LTIKKVKKYTYIFPPNNWPFIEMIAAPTQTITNTISKRRVLSEALVAVLKILLHKN
jgi:hypothetical protein